MDNTTDLARFAQEREELLAGAATALNLAAQLIPGLVTVEQMMEQVREQVQVTGEVDAYIHPTEPMTIIPIVYRRRDGLLLASEAQVTGFGCGISPSTGFSGVLNCASPDDTFVVSFVTMHSDSRGNTEVSTNFNFGDADGVRVYVPEELTRLVVAKLLAARDEDETD